MADVTGTALQITTVTGPSSGDGKYPYLYVPGTEHAKTPDELKEEMLEIYGEISASTLSDDDKTTAPTLAQFLLWHSAKQLAYVQYLAEQTGNWTDEHEIGTSPDVMHVVLSEDNEKLYILEDLQKSDISQMPYDDQVRVSATATWKSSVAPRLGMEPGWTIDTLTEAQDALLTGEDDVSVQILLDMIEAVLEDSEVPFDDEPFTKQLDLIADRIANQAILSPATIKEQLSELKGRLETAILYYQAIYGPNKQYDDPERRMFGAAFNESNFFDSYGFSDEPYSPGDEIHGSVIYRNETGLYLIMDSRDYNDVRDYFQNFRSDLDLSRFDPTHPYTNTISLDDNEKLKSGYALLIEKEYAVYESKKARDSLASTGTLNGLQLDGPTLIAMLQMYAGQEKDALAAIATELADQMRSLIEEMNYIVEMITTKWTTLYDISKTTQEKSFNNMSKDSTDGLTDKELRAIAMIDAGMRGISSHPMIAKNGLTLPQFEIISYMTSMDFKRLASSGSNDLGRYENLSGNDKEDHQLYGLRDDAYVTQYQHGLWEWAELTKTKVDSILTSISQFITSLTRTLDIIMTDVQTHEKKSSSNKKGSIDHLGMANQTVTRIGGNVS